MLFETKLAAKASTVLDPIEPVLEQADLTVVRLHDSLAAAKRYRFP